MTLFLIVYCLVYLFAPSFELLANNNDETIYYLLYKFTGSIKSQELGNGVYLAGDINGDGYGDILIGANSEDIGLLKSAGRAYIHSGLDGMLLYTYEGENEYAYLGWALSDIEDTDDDGLSEILIGSRNTEASGMAGAGRVYHCSGVNGVVYRKYDGESYSDSFGFDLEGLGDVDGDGYGDFIVGAESYAVNPPWNRGAVYVYSGRPRMLKHKGRMPIQKYDPHRLLFKYEGEYTSESLGFQVCRIGDVDKDNRADFAYLVSVT